MKRIAIATIISISLLAGYANANDVLTVDFRFEIPQYVSIDENNFVKNIPGHNVRSNRNELFNPDSVTSNTDWKVYVSTSSDDNEYTEYKSNDNTNVELPEETEQVDEVNLTYTILLNQEV